MYVHRCTVTGRGVQAIGRGAGLGRAGYMPDIIFLDRQRKILGFFGLRGIDMGAWRYNLESKEVIAKIFQDKELARLGIAGFGLGCGDGLDRKSTRLNSSH